MNIFLTSPSPIASARWLCKEHLHKMPLESTQLLSTALYELSDYDSDYLHNEVGLYLPVHVSHPSRLWISESPNNFSWLLSHVQEMFARLDKLDRKNKSQQVVFRISKFFSEEMQSLHFSTNELTPILFAMGDKRKTDYRDIKDEFGIQISETRWRARSINMGALGYQEYVRRKQFLPTKKADKALNILRRPTWNTDQPIPTWYKPV